MAKNPKTAKHCYTLAWALASLRSWSKGNLVADGRTWRKFTLPQTPLQPTLTINVHLVQHWLTWWCRGFCKPEIDMTFAITKKIHLCQSNLWKKLMTKGRSLENGWGEAWVVEIPNKSKIIRTSMICCLQIFLEENLKRLKEILELNCRTSKREPWLAQKYFVTVFSFHLHLYLPVVSG